MWAVFHLTQSVAGLSYPLFQKGYSNTGTIGKRLIPGKTSGPVNWCGGGTLRHYPRKHGPRSRIRLPRWSSQGQHRQRGRRARANVIRGSCITILRRPSPHFDILDPREAGRYDLDNRSARLGILSGSGPDFFVWRPDL